MSRARTSLRVWGAPSVLGVLSAIGLTSALLDDGAGDVLAWVTLAVPVLVVAWCLRPSSTGRKSHQS